MPRQTIGWGVVGRIDAQLGGVHPDANDPPRRTLTTQVHEMFNKLEPSAATERSIHVADEHDPGPGLLLARSEAALKPEHDLLEVLTAGQMSGRGEEALAIDHPVGSAVDHRLVGETSPVVAGLEARLSKPEDLQEPVEAVEPVEPQGIAGREREAPVLGERDQGFRADRALDLAVQLDLGQVVERLIEREGTVRDHRAASCAPRLARDPGTAGLYLRPSRT